MEVLSQFGTGFGHLQAKPGVNALARGFVTEKRPHLRSPSWIASVVFVASGQTEYPWGTSCPGARSIEMRFPAQQARFVQLPSYASVVVTRPTRHAPISTRIGGSAGVE